MRLCMRICIRICVRIRIRIRISISISSSISIRIRIRIRICIRICIPITIPILILIRIPCQDPRAYKYNRNVKSANQLNNRHTKLAQTHTQNRTLTRILPLLQLPVSQALVFRN